MSEEQCQAAFRSYDAGGLPESGIGLALVKSIAQLFDMRLSVEAVPQQGNLFRIEIPLVPDDGAVTEQPEATTGIVDRIVDHTIGFEEASQPCFLDADGHRKFRILLVENDADSKTGVDQAFAETFPCVERGDGRRGAVAAQIPEYRRGHLRHAAVGHERGRICVR